ncbi:MAG TPA: nuclear transport factor 2 family protein [Gaiellaceae bacterium]|nr:nuclear transport factor 2 family protein [Gaiellaceae bacterium]
MEPLEENKLIVLRQIEALNAGDAEASRRFAHPDFYDHEALPGRPGSRFEPLDIVAEDDRVVVRGRVGGRALSSPQIHIWRLADGLIVEHWCVGDPGSNNHKGET